MSLVSVGANSTAFAGDCAETPAREALHQAALVFEGRVEKIEPLDYPVAGSDRLTVHQPLAGSPAIVTFSTSRNWKGSPHKSVKTVVLTQPEVGGFKFEKGQEYVVYTNAPSKWERVTSNSRNEPVYDLGLGCPLRIRSDVAAEVARLGGGK